MKIYNGWIEHIKHQASPNYNERPENIAIELLVIHNISLPSGEFNTPWINCLFMNDWPEDIKTIPEALQSLITVKVSAHLVIKRTGELIQYVSFDKRAWHAGKSYYRGRENCNDFSIGIELEGTDTVAYEDIQYQQLAKVTQRLLKHYPSLKPEHIIGHCDIAPDRKTDPGPSFDWQYYKMLMNRQ